MSSAAKTLLITSSIRGDASVSSRLASRLADRLAPGGYVRRDLSSGIEMIDGAWIGAAFTAPEDRSPEQQARIALSDALIAELKAADQVVIAVPVYNFSVPAQLKTWFDHVARAGVTFQYSEAGPEGLLKGKKAYLALASGGTGMGSPIDFATPWLHQMLGFIGIEDVKSVAADLQGSTEKAEALAMIEIERLAA